MKIRLILPLLLCFLTALSITPGQAIMQKVCAGTLPQRLVVGGRGQLTNTGLGQKPVPVRVRENPGTRSKVIAQLEDGLIFQVLSGPECKDGYAWWQVSSEGILGWIAEGDATDYFVEPVASQATAAATQEVTSTPVVIGVTPTLAPISVPAAGIFAAFKPGPVNTGGAIPVYQVAADFGNVVMAEALSPNQLDYLQRNHFVVSPGTAREFYVVYQKAHDSYQPLFISADSLLHGFHLAFDRVLRTAEVRHFYARLRDLSISTLIEADKHYQTLKGTDWESAARHTVAYLAVPVRLLDPGTDVPDYASDLVATEIANINNVAGIGPSAIFPNLPGGEDWSQYFPRGHYTRSEQLSAYFRAMMYYGRMTFHLSDPEETKAALLLVAAMRNAKVAGVPGLAAWNDLYEPTSFFVGQSDSLTIPQYAALVDHVYGAKADVKTIVGKGIDPFIAAATSLPPPKTLTSLVVQDQDSDTKGLRFMGQRFVWDAYAFSQLIYDKVGTAKKPRTVPSGLDVLAAMGSDRAFQILDKEGATAYDHYSDQMNKLRRQMGTLRESDWTGTLYGAWFYTANSMNQPVPGGYPGFMANQPYTDRALFASLGSYAELKHDTILYAEQALPLSGGGGPNSRKTLPPEPVRPPNYVEPVPLVWARLAALAEMTRDGLAKRNLLDPGDAEMLTTIAKLARRLQADSITELTNQPLSAEEQAALSTYGDDLQKILIAAADKPDAQSSLVRLQDSQAALVADIATDPAKGRVLEIGTGNIFDLYAIVPVAGKLYLAHGGAYSYYEFLSQNRLNDEAWQELLASKKPPALPDWTFSFLSQNAADPALVSEIQDFHINVTNTLWYDPVYAYEQIRQSTEKLDRYIASQLEPLAKARQYEGRQLVEMSVRSVELKTVKNVPTAVIVVREIWRGELHNSGPETDVDGPKIGERGPYTIEATYTLTRDQEGLWTLVDITVNGSVPGWTQTVP